MAETTKEQGKVKGRGQNPNSRKNLEKGQWAKGKSGNPNGKAAGTPDRATIIKKWADTAIQVANPSDPKGPKLEVSLLDYATLGQFMSAGKGNTNAFKELQDSLHGKIADKTEVTGKDGGAIENKIIVEIISNDGNGTNDADKD